MLADTLHTTSDVQGRDDSRGETSLKMLFEIDEADIEAFKYQSSGGHRRRNCRLQGQRREGCRPHLPSHAEESRRAEDRVRKLSAGRDEKAPGSADQKQGVMVVLCFRMIPPAAEKSRQGGARINRRRRRRVWKGNGRSSRISSIKSQASMYRLAFAYTHSREAALDIVQGIPWCRL